jgi:hypothetical protein
MASPEQFEAAVPPPAPKAAAPMNKARKPEPPLIARVLERRAMEQMSPALPRDPEPGEPRVEEDMQKQIADATARAVRELKALTGALQKSGN